MVDGADNSALSQAGIFLQRSGASRISDKGVTDECKKLVIRTGLKAGALIDNHNQVRVKTKVKAGRWSRTQPGAGEDEGEAGH